MRCVPEAVNRLFPELDLSTFKARPNGYGLGDIQRMLPTEFSVWPLYVNHVKRAENADIIKVIPPTENKIPLFLFSPKHCVFAIWNRSSIIVFDGDTVTEFDADMFFKTHKIYQISGVVSYDSYDLLTLRP